MREEAGGGTEAPPERERGPPKPLPANICRCAPASGRVLAVVVLGVALSERQAPTGQSTPTPKCVQAESAYLMPGNDPKYQDNVWHTLRAWLLFLQRCVSLMSARNAQVSYMLQHPLRGSAPDRSTIASSKHFVPLHVCTVMNSIGS